MPLALRLLQRGAAGPTSGQKRWPWAHRRGFPGKLLFRCPDLKACLMDAEDASWSRALALCPATDDAPLLALKLNAFQVGMHTVAALATLVLLQKAGLRHVKSLLPRMR
ncbi:unnamed protein product [Durusdinium trenchii]|uniref:Uncharacterized protein n=1 Tax=Durusdinium trenchii TaxID=1381693 RepID=A0ABP0LHK7_9DINO